MSTRVTLLDLLGTGKLPPQAERKFIEFCIWQQARPAIVQILRAASLEAQAGEAGQARDLASLTACVRDAAATAERAGLPVLALGAVQAAAAELAQLGEAADPTDGDPEEVSFHAARLAGWASWAENSFQTGMFKTSGEEVAYGTQLQALMTLVGAV